LTHLRGLVFKEHADRLIVDPLTLKHLEIVESTDGGRAGSLLNELDRTMTPMGARLLRTWLIRPLLSLERIRDRLDAVEDFAFRTTERGKFRDALRTMHDIERLVARTALGTAGPRDLVALRTSLAAVPRLRQLLSGFQAPFVSSLASELDEVADVREAIEEALVDEPPALAREGGYVRDGVDPELDELRRISTSGKQVIAELEEQERARTGISSLKVRYNRVFGYYIEVSKSNLHAVPPDYHRKQTMRAASASSRRRSRRTKSACSARTNGFSSARSRCSRRCAPRWPPSAAPAGHRQGRRHAGRARALAEAAAQHNYVKPNVHDGDELTILDGRHPVVERYSPDPFVPTTRNSTARTASSSS